MIKNFKTWYFFTVTGLIFTLVSLVVTAQMYSSSDFERILFFSIFAIQAFFVMIFLWFLMVSKIKQRSLIANSFQYYVEEIIANSGIGILVFDENEDIVWVSSYLEKKGFDQFLGISLTNVIEDHSYLMSGIKNAVIKLNGTIFEYTFFHHKNVILLKDVTSENELTSRFINEKIVLAELEIDNYAQYQIDLGDEGTFKLQRIVTDKLDEMKKDFQIIYRQYSNGKFLIISNKESLKMMEANRFGFLEDIHISGKKLKIRANISLGVSEENLILRELEKNSQEALKQAQSRGGDQVVVISPNKSIRTYGGNSEAMFSESKIKVKSFSERLIKKIRSSTIKNVVIHGHVKSDLDAIGAALGVYAIVKSLSSKPVNIANVDWDNTTRKAINKLFKKQEIDEIFTNNKKTKMLSGPNTLIVVVDTSTHFLIEQFTTMVNINRKNVFIFDHHRTGAIKIKHEQQNVYIDTTASSASEIISEIISFSTTKINLSSAQVNMLLCGIYLDTNRFSKTTSWRTFDAAANLEKWGADAKFALEVLKISEQDSLTLKKILKNLIQIKEGYFLTVYDDVAPDDIVAKAADEILRTAGRKASFVIAKVPQSKEYKLSARSIGVNIQKIAESVGGGGHFSAAAARSKEELEVFKANIIQAIITDESNYN